MALLQISEPGQSTAPHQHKFAAGIDLGTTNSLVATVRSGESQCLADSEGRWLLPSVVHFSDEQTLIGHAALALQSQDPLNTISSIKRFMGRGIDDIPQLDDVMPYQISLQEGSVVPRIDVNGGSYTAVEISSLILKELSSRASHSLGGELSGVVITVPAYFDDAQRQATRDAATLAGLNVFRLLNEPTAAAVAYGLDQQTEGTVAVYDLGGGTFDISILTLNKGVFEVLATGGNSSLGGDDMDHAIGEWIVEQGELKNLDATSSRRILIAARRAKEALSEAMHTEISVLVNDSEIKLTLNRSQFEQLIQPLVDKTLKACRLALRDAKLTKDDIAEVILVGGSTRVPLVQKMVGEFYQSTPVCDIDPDQVVAIGAAMQADVLAGNKPDSEMLLLDVLPLSLGIETMGGLSEKIIDRNTSIPVARAQEFTTFKDGQTAMSVHVVQGERELVSDCRSLARFELRGFPPMVAGAARIRVSYQVDADGMLSVKAEELTSGVVADIIIKPSYGLGDDEIAAMLRASMDNAKGDIEARMLAEQQVEASRVIEALDSALADDGDKLLSAEESNTILLHRNALEAALNNASSDKLKQLIKSVEVASEGYVAKRMNASVTQALTGKRVDEVNI